MLNLLPPEIKINIVKFLDLRDILNCRLICHDFNHVITINIRVFDLSIYKEANLVRNNRFFLTNGLIRETEYHLDSNLNLDSNLFKYDSISIIFSKLKRLFLFNCIFDEFLIVLNQLYQLEQLQIHRFDLFNNSTLKLSNLKIISFEDLLYTACILTIDCENLDSFRINCCNLFKVRFIHTHSIKTIETDFFNSILLPFKSLERLYVKTSKSYLFYPRGSRGSIDIVGSLKYFNNLKELHIYENLNALMIDLFNSRNAIGSKVNFFVSGLKIKDENHYNNLLEQNNHLPGSLSGGIDFINKNLLVINNNYDQFTNDNNWEYKIQYDLLIGTLNSIPINFFEKFLNIIQVDVCGVVDENDLLDFVCNCSVVKILKFESVNFSQNFYNKLHHSKYFGELTIHKSNSIDFNFILKCRFLKRLSTDQNMLSINLIIDIIKSLKHLEDLDFYFNHQEFKITIHGKYARLQTNSSDEFNGDKFKLVKHLKKLNNYTC